MMELDMVKFFFLQLRGSKFRRGIFVSSQLVSKSIILSIDKKVGNWVSCLAAAPLCADVAMRACRCSYGVCRFGAGVGFPGGLVGWVSLCRCGETCLCPVELRNRGRGRGIFFLGLIWVFCNLEIWVG